MDPIRFCAEVDAHPWADLTHAYGSAADVPDCLRALAGDDDEKAAEALSELYGSILHQGSVYEATAHAVPFLARTAAAGIRAADVLALLGGMAESGADDGDGDEAAVRRAVTAELPLLLASVEAEDSGVRQAAGWAAAMTGATDTAYGVLRDRFAVETDPQVRAELLGGLVHLDPAGTVTLATRAAGPDEPAEVRIAALMGCVDAGADWGPGHHDAMLALLPADHLVAGRIDLDRSEPLQYVVSSLLLRNTPSDRDGAYALLAAALRTGRPEVLAEAAWASESAVQISRSARERLAGPLCDAILLDPEITEAVLPLLRLLGGHAAQAGPVLARLAARDDGRADQALAALVDVDPERAVPLLARDLARRPRALDAACGGLFGSPRVPCDAALLAAVRARLAEPDALGGQEPYRYAALLESWGSRASSALPEVLAALGKFPQQMARALAAVCAPEDRAAAGGALRREARSGQREGGLGAARALHELTGDTEPLLTVLAGRLEDGDAHGTSEAASLAAGLGPRAAVLLPALSAAVSDPAADRTTPELDADIAVADALWRIAGRAEEAVRLLRGPLSGTGPSWMRWTVSRAARVAALLGDEGRPLTEELRRLLPDPLQTPVTVLALCAVAPETLDVPRTAGLLLDSMEQDADPFTALDALLGLGPEALAGDNRGRLTELAERDPRVTASRVEGATASADERFQERAREVLRALREPGEGA
ncbi:hypothetical protein OG265_30405 [Streptomyces sp. NBC_01208]|uniref:hypothetical protein n=1 Tax=Streptomyces sp. NBC_01208 TaxID=2903773 RepID=UPI002E107884|nr:hypothetical protein OG265_30405 [Streptomyces sp. NBC_01208]